MDHNEKKGPNTPAPFVRGRMSKHERAAYVEGCSAALNGADRQENGYRSGLTCAQAWWAGYDATVASLAPPRVMNESDIRLQLVDISELAAAGDDEAAYSREISLYQNVLEAIAAGTCTAPGAMATVALRAAEIKMKRNTA